MEILLIGLNILLIALIIYLIISVKSKNNNIDVDKLKDSISEDIEDVIKEETKEIKSDLKSSLDQNTALQLKLVTDGQKTQTEMLLKLQEVSMEGNDMKNVSLTKDISDATHITHGGNFHADEVFATVILAKVYE